MADELLLASARVEPERLKQNGFMFGHPTLEEALRHVLGRHELSGVMP
jgi:NAD dependent epimerase/dehydratase family enzyme